jgi:formate dehydrogenase subunit gamma
MAVPALYALLDPKGLKTLLKESFHYDREDLEWFKRAPGYFLGHASKMPPQGHLNAGQKLHHAAIIISFVTISLSGLVMWFGRDYVDATGLALMAIVHDLSMLLMTVLTIGHVYFTFVYGALPGMVSGYVSEEYARMEHAKWLARLSESESEAAARPDRAEAPQAAQ